MKIRATIAVLVALLIWTGAALVRVENQRYAMQLGMCRGNVIAVDLACLKNVQTRTGWWWHMYYALIE
ncbi:hypothetical protein RQP54_17805 [Curvibacter sp. APW13]|uniref:hypothetical protein n=1 Tax=Curvibacter sp. APW13 TaxID=3077236 RepID=UPI0028DE0B8D|nr:hypothetical protein [Curvibacter sp. APW13]MDT8992732.1 hypothetical protein [Curvibacter sp. APW13]